MRTLFYPSGKVDGEWFLTERSKLPSSEEEDDARADRVNFFLLESVSLLDDIFYLNDGS